MPAYISLGIIILGFTFILVFNIFIMIKYNKFCKYLENINDYGTLTKIGRLTSSGYKVYARVPFPMLKKIITKKYDEIKDIKYLKFCHLHKKYDRLIKKSIPLHITSLPLSK